MLVWLIGLSGAGKTTIGTELVRRIKPIHPNVFFLDGDIFRAMLGDDLDYSVGARLENAKRLSNFCAEMSRQNIHVICAAMSLFPEWRETNRARIDDYFEVFLDIPLETIEARDPKGIYAAARAGKEKDVIGIDIPFPAPTQPDLVISDTDQNEGVDHCATKILDATGILLK